MQFEVVDLRPWHLEKLIVLPPAGPVTMETLERSYFSEGSAAYCLLSKDDPVFAGGIVNLQWHRGEIWMTPNLFFHRHVKTCFKLMKNMLPGFVARGHFKRVQLVCSGKVPEGLFLHLGFEYEGTLKSFGPAGEECRMYARVFN